MFVMEFTAERAAAGALAGDETVISWSVFLYYV